MVFTRRSTRRAGTMRNSAQVKQTAMPESKKPMSQEQANIIHGVLDQINRESANTDFTWRVKDEGITVVGNTQRCVFTNTELFAFGNAIKDRSLTIERSGAGVRFTIE